MFLTIINNDNNKLTRNRTRDLMYTYIMQRFITLPHLFVNNRTNIITNKYQLTFSNLQFILYCRLDMINLFFFEINDKLVINIRMNQVRLNYIIIEKLLFFIIIIIIYIYYTKC